MSASGSLRSQLGLAGSQESPLATEQFLVCILQLGELSLDAGPLVKASSPHIYRVQGCAQWPPVS